MIERISFQNFKALRDVTVPLAPLTLIVGPNASGKTSILEGMHHLSQLAEAPPGAAFCLKLAAQRHRSTESQKTIRITLVGTWGESAGEFAFQLQSAVNGKVPVCDSRALWEGLSVDLNTGPNIHTHRLAYVYADQPLLTVLRGAAFLHLEPGKLSQPSFSEDPAVRTESDGSNLAASIAEMKLQDEERYAELIGRLRQIVPSVKAIRFPTTPVEEYRFDPVTINNETLFKRVNVRSKAYQAVFDTVSGNEVVASYASEGTLLTLGLLSVIYGPSQPRLLLIDELERGLHPKALGILVAQIRELQKQFPDLQVVATTHSPYLVDHFEADEVILTALKEDGSVVAARLSDHPDFAKWKDEMGTGEFWSTVGEAWVTQRESTPRA